MPALLDVVCYIIGIISALTGLAMIAGWRVKNPHISAGPISFDLQKPGIQFKGSEAAFALALGAALILAPSVVSLFKPVERIIVPGPPPPELPKEAEWTASEPVGVSSQGETQAKFFCAVPPANYRFVAGSGNYKIIQDSENEGYSSQNEHWVTENTDSRICVRLSARPHKSYSIAKIYVEIKGTIIRK